MSIFSAKRETSKFPFKTTLISRAKNFGLSAPDLLLSKPAPETVTKMRRGSRKLRSLPFRKYLTLLIGTGGLVACSNQAMTGEEFADHAKTNKVGAANDYMLELSNSAGEWEPVMFVFGYATSEGTRIECENAAKGLKKVNYAREYRCVLAN